MRNTLPLLALSALLSGASLAHAQVEPSEAERRAMLERTFGATIISTYPDGRHAKLWLQRDGSYQMESRRHDHSDGRWQVKGDKLCMKQSHPIPAPFAFCTPTPSTLDRPWQAKAFTGETVTLQLLEAPKPAPPQDSGQRKAQGEVRPTSGDNG